MGRRRGGDLIGRRKDEEGRKEGKRTRSWLIEEFDAIHTYTYTKIGIRKRMSISFDLRSSLNEGKDDKRNFTSPRIPSPPPPKAQKRRNNNKRHTSDEVTSSNTNGSFSLDASSSDTKTDDPALVAAKSRMGLPRSIVRRTVEDDKSSVEK